MPRESRPLKPRTLKEAAAHARWLMRRSVEDRNPPWGDERLREDLELLAAALEWALRLGKNPLGPILAAEMDRRRKREGAARGC